MGGAEPNHESFFGLELHFHASAAEVDFPAVNLPVKLLIDKRTDSSEIPLRGSKCFFIIPNIRNKNISTNTIDMLTQISSNPAKDNIRFATEKILFISMIKAFITIDLGRKFSNQINCSASISNPGN